MFQDEIRQLLRELAGVTGAPRIAIVHEPAGGPPGAPIQLSGFVAEPGSGPAGLRFPLGKGAYLHLERAAAEEPDTAAAGALGMEQRMAVERTVRAVRTAVRRWQYDRAPAMSVTASELAPPPHERVRERIRVYLEALANTHGAANVLITLQGQVLASSMPVQELQRERIPFTLRRLEVEASRHPGRSHAELAGEDFYAASFWLDACMVAFFPSPYALDFFRHRARMVIRELSLLLPMLDDDDPPPGAAHEAPIPE